MEYVCGEGHQGREIRVAGREADLEAEDGGGIGTYLTMASQLASEGANTNSARHSNQLLG
mgnify:CR=1 FL=1